MKKRVTIPAILLFITLAAFSQKNPIDDLFDKYSGKEGVTTIFISSRMFSMIAQVDLDDEELQELVTNLKSIRIMTISDSLLNEKINFYEELGRRLDYDKYEELMVVKDGGKDLIFLIKEKGNKRIEELLMVGGGTGSNVLLSIKGDLDLKNIAEISKNIGIDELNDIDRQTGKRDE